MLASEKEVQQIDREGGENRSHYLKAESIPLRQQFAAPASTRAFYEVVRFENVGDADAREC
jgi:hypothetical protein